MIASYRSRVVLCFLAAARICVPQTTGATFGDVIRLTGTPSDIVLDESRSRLYLVNSNTGNVDIYDYANKVLSGSIRVGSAKGTHVNLKNAGGNIELGEAGGDVSAETSSGSIKINFAKGAVLAKDAGGDVFLGDIAGELNAQTSSGSVKVLSPAPDS